MFASQVYRFRKALCFTFLTALFAISVNAQSSMQSSTQSSISLRGRIVDPLGNAVPNAKIVLLQGDKEIANGNSNGQGSFDLAVPAAGRYTPRIEATGFATRVLPTVMVTSGKMEELRVSLQIGPLLQEIVVSATGIATPETQVGASVSLIEHTEIAAQNKLDVLEDLRLVPGAQIVQTGQRGGTTSLYIRGGDSDFNKVLIDGIPVNNIGGTFDYGQLSNNGIASVEVLRGSNSALYGSDALAGVVNITSERGTSSIPELKYSVDGGNFGTLNQDVSLGGAIHGFDYFSEFSRFDTRGNYPNDTFHNATISANVGWELNQTTGIRLTVRRATTDLGDPNAILLYGISDDSSLRIQNTYVGGTAQQQTTDRWHNSIQFAFMQFYSLFVNPTPTGEPSNGDYLGNLVTIRGANGYSVTGQGILDYAGTYPQSSPDYEARRSIYAQSDYRFYGDWTGIAGFRYEHEDGEGFTRNNYSSFLQGHGSLVHRLFLTGGVGLENNAVFGFATSPRVSVAYYLRRPSATSFFGETKLKFNFGKGIEEPSTFQQANSLIDLLTPSQVEQFGVTPLGPQRSKTFDGGVEQRLWNGRANLGITFFYNDFYNLIVDFGPPALLSIGVPPAIVSNTPFGAYLNANSERALGTEVDFKTDLGHGLIFQGEYTYLDAVITSAVTTTAAINPLFPNIPIGAYSPLQGARPFRQAPHSGSLMLTYTRKKFSTALSGYLVSRRDDSTFILDGNFENTMLLPNRNLAPAYQKFDLSGGYSLTPYLRIYTSIENLFNEHYQAVFGFPALPFEIRSGLTFTLGGRSALWK